MARETTARALQRRDGERSRPRLRLVEQTEHHRVRAARVGTVAATVFLVALFALAGFQTVIINSQSRLDDLDARVRTEGERQEGLMLELSEMRSPQRITTTARDRLGMITPNSVTFLEPQADDDERARLTSSDGEP
jgi:cell division protein FtsL